MRGIDHPADNGGRRLGFERRYFSYSAHIPERRSVPGRRNGRDRRYVFAGGLITMEKRFFNGPEMERKATAF